MFVEEKKLLMNLYIPLLAVDVILELNKQYALLNINYNLQKKYCSGWKRYVPELVLVTNSDAGKLNARSVFYRYVNVSVTLIINDDSVGDLIDE